MNKYMGFIQLINYLSSFADNELRTPASFVLSCCGISEHDEQKKEAINKEILSLLKREIRKRFDQDDAEYYCQLVEKTKSDCDTLSKMSKEAFPSYKYR